jgi:hypothetical protein
MTDIKEGKQTTEYLLTQKTNTISTLVLGLGLLLEGLSKFSEELGNSTPTWISPLLIVGGLAVRVLNTMGYQWSRATVKAASATATKVLLVLALISITPGCFEVRSYDPQTVKNIDLSIQRTKERIRLLEQLLGVEGVDSRLIAGQVSTEEAELIRYETWRFLEDKKKKDK